MLREAVAAIAFGCDTEAKSGRRGQDKGGGNLTARFPVRRFVSSIRLAISAPRRWMKVERDKKGFEGNDGGF